MHSAEPMKTIADPACGTGGFFLASYDYLVANNKLDKDQNKFIKLKAFYGNEIVAEHPATGFDEFVFAQYRRYRQR